MRPLHLRQTMRNQKRLLRQMSPRPKPPQRRRNPASSKPKPQRRSRSPVARLSLNRQIPARRTSLNLLNPPKMLHRPRNQPRNQPRSQLRSQRSHSHPRTSPPQHSPPNPSKPRDQRLKKSQPSHSRLTSPPSNRMARRRQPPMATQLSQKLEMTRYLPASSKRASSISSSELASISRILRTSMTLRAAT